MIQKLIVISRGTKLVSYQQLQMSRNYLTLKVGGLKKIANITSLQFTPIIQKHLMFYMPVISIFNQIINQVLKVTVPWFHVVLLARTPKMLQERHTISQTITNHSIVMYPVMISPSILIPIMMKMPNSPKETTTISLNTLAGLSIKHLQLHSVHIYLMLHTCLLTIQLLK